MNGKLIAAVAAGLLCGAASAEVTAKLSDNTTEQTFCRIAITSGRADTVLAIPLVNAGATAGTTIDVTKFVLTENLVAGDKLYKRTGDTWEYWTLQSDKTWKAETVIQGDQGNPSGSTLPVGNCIMLSRTGNLSLPFYLYGMVPAASAITPQTAPKDVWTLLGNPLPAAVSLATFTEKATPGNGDKIYLSNGEKGVAEYTYNGTGWGYWDWANAKEGDYGAPVVDWASADNVEIPVGEGFMFVGKATRTVNWTTAPASGN